MRYGLPIRGSPSLPSMLGTGRQFDVWCIRCTSWNLLSKEPTGSLNLHPAEWLGAFSSDLRPKFRNPELHLKGVSFAIPSARLRPRLIVLLTLKVVRRLPAGPPVVSTYYGRSFKSILGLPFKHLFATWTAVRKQVQQNCPLSTILRQRLCLPENIPQAGSLQRHLSKNSSQEITRIPAPLLRLAGGVRAGSEGRAAAESAGATVA